MDVDVPSPNKNARRLNKIDKFRENDVIGLNKIDNFREIYLLVTLPGLSCRICSLVGLVGVLSALVVFILGFLFLH